MLSAEKQLAFVYLKNMNWYTLWESNFGTGRNFSYTIDTFLRVYPINQWINYPQEWRMTPQGHVYWAKINTMWMNRGW